MELFIDILLLLLASAATLVALCGDSIEKGEIPLLKRVTTLGWVSMGLLIAALFVGFIDQIQSATASDENNKALNETTRKLEQANDKLVSSEKNIKQLSKDLKNAQTERLSATKERDLMTELLTNSKARVSDLQNQVSKLQIELQRVPKEVDHTVAQLGEADEDLFKNTTPFKYQTKLISGNTGKALLVSGGDVLDYDLIFNPHDAVGGSRNTQGKFLTLDEALRKEVTVKLRIGDIVRRLSEGSGKIYVLGEVKAKMEAVVEVESKHYMPPNMLILKLSVMRSISSEKPVFKKKK